MFQSAQGARQSVLHWLYTAGGIRARETRPDFTGYQENRPLKRGIPLPGPAKREKPGRQSARSRGRKPPQRSVRNENLECLICVN